MKNVGLSQNYLRRVSTVMQGRVIQPLLIQRWLSENERLFQRNVPITSWCSPVATSAALSPLRFNPALCFASSKQTPHMQANEIYKAQTSCAPLKPKRGNTCCGWGELFRPPAVTVKLAENFVKHFALSLSVSVFFLSRNMPRSQRRRMF